MKYQRVLAAVLACAMALALTACGGEAPVEDTAPAGVAVQVVLFAAVSAAALAVTRPLVRRYAAGKAVPTNLDRVLGDTGRVTETIDNARSAGAVYVDGKTWTARSADGAIIPEGAMVEIMRMEGVKLFVKKLEDKVEVMS